VLEVPTIAHVTLTVSHLDRSVQWYERLFDMIMHLDESPGPFRRAVWIVAGQTLVGLHEFPDPSDALPFDERRIGLDHLAFACRSRSDLEAWETRLDELGVAQAASSTPTMALRSPAVTRTTSPWNSSLRPFRRSGRRIVRAGPGGVGAPA
jgi:glyoxylase I family protein